jgi:hypothetical protein
MKTWPWTKIGDAERSMTGEIIKRITLNKIKFEIYYQLIRTIKLWL